MMNITIVNDKKIVRFSPDPGPLWNGPTPANQSRVPIEPENRNIA